MRVHNGLARVLSLFRADLPFGQPAAASFSSWGPQGRAANGRSRTGKEREAATVEAKTSASGAGPAARADPIDHVIELQNHHVTCLGTHCSPPRSLLNLDIITTMLFAVLAHCTSALRDEGNLSGCTLYGRQQLSRKAVLIPGPSAAYPSPPP